jgi:hypothetical protein
MNIKKGQHMASPKKSRLHNTTAQAQRKRLLDALIELGAVNTLYARDILNVMAPAPRIKELRELGHHIHTDRITIKDRNGFIHDNVARYVLIAIAEVNLCVDI